MGLLSLSPAQSPIISHLKYGQLDLEFDFSAVNLVVILDQLVSSNVALPAQLVLPYYWLIAWGILPYQMLLVWYILPYYRWNLHKAPVLCWPKVIRKTFMQKQVNYCKIPFASALWTPILFILTL